MDRFSGTSYGWKPDFEITLIVARLFMAGEIKLAMEGSDLDAKTAADPLTKPVRYKQVSILKRKVADAGSLKRARDLHKDLFAALARDDEDGLVADFRSQLGSWSTGFVSFAPVAAQKHCPGKPSVDTLAARIGKQQGIRDPFEYIEALNKDKEAWLDAGEDVGDLTAFHKQQVATWRKLLDALTLFDANRQALVKDAKAAAGLKELEALRANPAPYSQVNRIDPLVATVQAVNDQLAQDKREAALLSITAKILETQDALDKAHATPELSNQVLLPLQQLKLQVAALSSIPQIMYLQDQASDRIDEAMDAIAAAMPKPVLKVAEPTKTAPGAATGSLPAVLVPLSTGHLTGTAPKPSVTVDAASVSLKTYPWCRLASVSVSSEIVAVSCHC